ncbi:MAG: SEL1-like repeat protein, partial [Alphaproteobacteria bacterium]|nr:SEL1-like repeat protein [Alphaproteobacteria bacterium]
MRKARVALAAALLWSLFGTAASQALGQQREDDIVPALRSAVAAYRAGNLAAAEAELRHLAPGSPDAEAWLGAVLVDRGQAREALQYLQHAMAAGSSEGALQLGVVYAQGLVGQPRDDARAAELFEKAATAGNRRAALNLGILYFRGQGVPRDLVQARAWLEKASAGNNPYAFYALARTMEVSEGQALADPVRAADLYRRAAEQGHPLAA